MTHCFEVFLYFRFLFWGIFMSIVSFNKNKEFRRKRIWRKYSIHLCNLTAENKMKSSKDSKKDSKSEIEKRDARILVRPIFFHKLLNLMTNSRLFSNNINNSFWYFYVSEKYRNWKMKTGNWEWSLTSIKFCLIGKIQQLPVSIVLQVML